MILGIGGEGAYRLIRKLKSISLLLREFSQLTNHLFPDRSQNNFKVLTWYLYFALKSETRTALKLRWDTTSEKSYVWDNFNKWIRFQINFIDPRYWAKSPVIISVSGGHNQVFWKDVCNSKGISPDNHRTLYDLATRYSEMFLGFKAMDFFYSLSGQRIALEFARLKYQSESIRSALNNIIEIGPGFGGLSSSVLLSDRVTYTGIDTPEMSEIFKVIVSNLFLKNGNIRVIQNDILAIESLENELQSVNFSVFGQWSFSEIPINLRENYFRLIAHSRISFFTSNAKLNDIDNFLFFEDLSVKLSKSLEILSIQDVLGDYLPSYLAKHQVFILT